MLENTNLKYLKLYNWGRTIIISGILKYGDKFPSENILQKKFAYSRQTVRAALNLLENEGLITRTRGSGTYVSYKIVKTDENTKTIGLMLSYFADYLFPQIYQGIESVMLEHNIKIDVAVTKNNLNNEAMYLERFHNTNVSGIIIEGTKTSFPNPNINLYEKLRKKKMGGILGVGGSSAFPPYLVVLRYKGNPKRGEITAIVGKGVTVDTGGYCLKPSQFMAGIRGDNGGAAAVVGAIAILAKLKAKVNVTAIVPTVENKIAPDSYVDGDVRKAD